MSTWRDFFNGEHSIYVNDRHRTLHDQRVARDVASLVRELSRGPRPVVLDYGCGEATEAPVVAAAAETLLLSDAAPAIRERLRARFATDPRIQVLSPEEVAAQPHGSVDIVVVNSLLQYLTHTEFTGLCDTAFDLLRPGGWIVLGDVIPPDVSPVTDASALLRFGWEGGFLLASLGGLVRTALSDYRKLRQELGLTTYGEEDMIALLQACGFEAHRRIPNIGHNQARMTFLARKPA
ncbi:MAG: class I SAM-dependent methyltransferase [Alsobacter sp.]